MRRYRRRRKIVVKSAKRAQLEAHGWAVGDAQDFLGLSDEEQAFINCKLAQPESLRRTRRDAGEPSPCGLKRRPLP
jgi:hypothetical protein